MSNKGLYLFLLRAILAPLAVGAIGFAIYILWSWWGTAGQFDPNVPMGNRLGEISVACFLLVGGLAVLYLALRSTPEVKSLFTDAPRKMTPNLALGAAAGPLREDITGQSKTNGPELPNLDAAPQKEPLRQSRR